MAIENQNYDPAAKYGGEWVADDIKDAAITGAKLSTGLGYFSKTVRMPENSTASTSVFGSSGLGVASTITGLFATSSTTAAVTVYLEGGSSSIGTCVLTSRDGTGFAAVSDTALESAAVAAGTNLVLYPDTAGEVQVTLTFEVG